MSQPIVLCVPVTSAHNKHTPHLMEWYAENRDKHNLVLHWALGRPLHKVQASAVEVAKEIDASHVLFTEHDQWGYPVDGLDVLLKDDKDVVGLPTYMRKYPYLPMCMRKKDPEISFVTTERNLVSFYPTQVLEQTDLITWAFTLVKTDVFRRMEEEGRNPWVWDTVPTDSHFCQHCEDMGIERWINASFFINHGEHRKEDVVFLRRCYDTINAANNRFGKGALPYVPQNDEDPHGVAPYETEAEKAMKRPAASIELTRPIKEVAA